MEAKKKIIKGVVVSSKGDKSIVVSIDYRIMHPKFKKFITRSKKIMAHDENSKAKEGDVVAIVSSRPYSKKKRYALQDVLQAAGN